MRALLVALALPVAGIVAGCSDGVSPVAIFTPASPAEDAGAGNGAPDLGKASRGVGGNWVSNPRLFASGPRFVSLASTPTQLLATTDGTTSAPLVSISETGVLQPFGTGFTVTPGTPCYVEVAPGFGEFAQGMILFGAGSELWQLAPDGRAALSFATLPAGDGAIAGLTFDTVGALHYDLVVLTTTGSVYYVDPSGQVIRIGSVGVGGRGASVATAGLGRFAGQVLVAFPAEHEVRALDAAGNLNVVLRWSGVSGAWSVPDDPRAYGETGAAVFVATEAGELFRYPLTDLAGHAGGLLLTSSLCSGSGMATCRNNNFTTQAFSRFMGGERAATFVRRQAYTLVNIEVLPGVAPKTIGYGSTTLVPVAILAGPGVSPRLLEGSEVRCSGADFVETPRQRTGFYRDVNGDGKLDLVVRFRPADMRLTPGDTALSLECTTLGGDQVRGTGAVHVLAQ
jgi:hypothetical protein